MVIDVITAMSVQADLDAVTEWTRKWLMRLNVAKCKVMHFGAGGTQYTIEDLSIDQRKPLEESTCERDLGVYVSSDLSWTKHIEEMVSKANRILGLLVRTFTSRDVDLWRNLYISLVRPHLEFASVVWNPYLRKDIDLIERVQKRATKIPTELCNLSYEERLRRWGLTTLEVRRVRGDLIQMYKVRNGIEEINWYTGPDYALPNQTRATARNDSSLRREIFPSKNRNNYSYFVSLRHNFFLNRVSESWNVLSNSEVHAPSVNSFKAKIDILMKTAAIACTQAQ